MKNEFRVLAAFERTQRVQTAKFRARTNEAPHSRTHAQTNETHALSFSLSACAAGRGRSGWGGAVGVDWREVARELELRFRLRR